MKTESEINKMLEERIDEYNRTKLMALLPDSSDLELLNKLELLIWELKTLSYICEREFEFMTYETVDIDSLKKSGKMLFFFREATPIIIEGFTGMLKLKPL